jgi:hypothetical protein
LKSRSSQLVRRGAARLSKHAYAPGPGRGSSHRSGCQGLSCGRHSRCARAGAHPRCLLRAVAATGEWAESVDVKLAPLSTSSRSGSCFCDELLDIAHSLQQLHFLKHGRFHDSSVAGRRWRPVKARGRMSRCVCRSAILVGSTPASLLRGMADVHDAPSACSHHRARLRAVSVHLSSRVCRGFRRVPPACALARSLATLGSRSSPAVDAAAAGAPTAAWCRCKARKWAQTQGTCPAAEPHHGALAAGAPATPLRIAAPRPTPSSQFPGALFSARQWHREATARAGELVLAAAKAQRGHRIANYGSRPQTVLILCHQVGSGWC